MNVKNTNTHTQHTAHH